MCYTEVKHLSHLPPPAPTKWFNGQEVGIEPVQTYSIFGIVCMTASICPPFHFCFTVVVCFGFRSEEYCALVWSATPFVTTVTFSLT